MKITATKPVKSQVTLTIEIEESDLAPFLDKAAAQLSKEVKIKGFRPGKIPRDMLEKHMGAGAIRAHAIDLALPQFYAEAILKEKVQAVARPEIKFTSEDPLIFEAIVPVMPEVKISGYDKIKIKKEKLEVEDKDVEDLIAHFQKQSATYNEVDRPAKKGDKVEVDFDGFDAKDDVALEGTSSKNHPVVLGEGGLIPGFEEEIEGMKAGEEKEFDITFPKDYHSKRFQGKKAKFKVKLNRVQEMHLPEVTKEWIKEASGEEKTPEQFRKDIKTHLETEKARQIRRKQEEQFLDELYKLGKIDLPNALIEEEIDYAIEQSKQDLAARGLQWDQYLKFIEEKGRNIREEKKEQATRQVSLRIIIQHLYKEEKIEATEEELTAKIEVIAQAQPKEEAGKAREYYKKGTAAYMQLENAVRLEKLLNKFLP